MAVPEFQTFMVPVLRALADGQTQHWRALREPVAADLALTEEDLAESIPTGQGRADNRLQWAISHMVQAALLTRPQRGHVRITERGQETLAANPDRVDMAVLKQFAEFREFRNRSTNRSQSSETSGTATSLGSPHETAAAAVSENNEAVAAEALRRVLEQPPEFLELLVLRLLTRMGYGGEVGAIEHRGRTGDGGIDGIIRQDALGLDRVYLQAKRYNDRTVGKPDIQAFVGALHGEQADRGVFITTSRFSTDAHEYVRQIPNRIVLIDGEHLAELMVLYNVGVQASQTFMLKRVDEDFFE